MSISVYVRLCILIVCILYRLCIFLYSMYLPLIYRTLYTLLFYAIYHNTLYYTTGKGVQEFPFRKETFITSPSKIKALLHWKPKRSLQTDLAADIAEVVYTT